MRLTEQDRQRLCYVTAELLRNLGIEKVRDPRKPAGGEAAELAIKRKIAGQVSTQEKKTLDALVRVTRRIDPADAASIRYAEERAALILTRHGQIVAPLGYDETLAGTEAYYKDVKRAWSADFDRPFTFSQIDEVAVDRITRWDAPRIGRHYRDKVTGQASRAINEAVRAQGGALSRRQISARLAKEFPSIVAQKGYWDIVAASVVTNARSYSSNVFYSEARIDNYEVVAVMDARTSEICRFMNGKIFSVQRTLQKYERMDAATTVEEANSVWPWMRTKMEDGKPVVLTREGTRADTLSAGELQARGYDAPGYHGRCRTTVVPQIG